MRREKGQALSIKLKLTLWFTMFMAILAAVCLGIILLINGSVARNEAHQILTYSVRANIPEVSLENGRLTLSPDFNFYANNVSMLIYNKDMALLSGQVPPSFPVNTEAENGTFRLVDDGNDRVLRDGFLDSLWLGGRRVASRGSGKSGRQPVSGKYFHSLFHRAAVLYPGGGAGGIFHRERGAGAHFAHRPDGGSHQRGKGS